MRLLLQGGGVTHRARNQAGDSLNHCHDRDLTAVEHVVAQGHGHHAEALLRPVQHALVDAFVACRGEDDVLLLRQLVRHRLIKHGTRRGRDNQQRASISGGFGGGPSALRLGALSRVFGSVQRGGGKYLIQRQAPRLRLHHHARAAAVRGVIHRAVTVKRVLTQIVQVQIHQTLLTSLTQQGQLQRLQVLGENRDHIVAHGLLPRLLGRLRRILLSVLDQVNQTRRRGQ